jgi:HAD superfamily hydrolase (TIGR01509 family)
MLAASEHVANLRAVLLDIDGTLVDSNDAHARAWEEALDHFGHSVPFDRLRALIGKGGDKLLAEVARIDKETPQGKQIDQLRERTFVRDYLPRLKPFPKARELLLRLREDGLRLVVATSAKRSEMDALLELCGASDLVHAHTSSDEADKSKPDPDIIQAALRKAEASAGECSMLGDTPYDVEAAGRCGVSAVGLRSGGWGDAELEGALAIYDDVADLLAHYEQSPFAQRRG